MTKRTILSIVVATVLLLVTFGFVYSMVLFKSNMAFEFEDAANAEEMAAAFDLAHIHVGALLKSSKNGEVAAQVAKG